MNPPRLVKRPQERVAPPQIKYQPLCENLNVPVLTRARIRVRNWLETYGAAKRGREVTELQENETINFAGRPDMLLRYNGVIEHKGAPVIQFTKSDGRRVVLPLTKHSGVSFDIYTTMVVGRDHAKLFSTGAPTSVQNISEKQAYVMVVYDKKTQEVVSTRWISIGARKEIIKNSYMPAQSSDRPALITDRLDPMTIAESVPDASVPRPQRRQLTNLALSLDEVARRLTDLIRGKDEVKVVAYLPPTGTPNTMEFEGLCLTIVQFRQAGAWTVNIDYTLSGHQHNYQVSSDRISRSPLREIGDDGWRARYGGRLIDGPEAPLRRYIFVADVVRPDGVPAGQMVLGAIERVK